MDHEHKEWLAQMERESRAKQESFMSGIAVKLGRRQITEEPVHPYRGAPEFWHQFEWSLEERIEQFMENFRSVGGHAIRLKGWGAVRHFIADKSTELGASTVIRQNVSELEELNMESLLPSKFRISVWNRKVGDDWKALAAEADLGIVLADGAAAYTGSIVVLSSKDKGRSVSLLPTVLFAVIPVERIKTRLGELLTVFDKTGGEKLPAGIHFISGPSRSADIENDLTIGVHGPGIVYAIILE